MHIVEKKPYLVYNFCVRKRENMSKERVDDLNLNGKKIIQNPEYFCFGIDSVLLSNFVESNSSNNVIVDLCSGSGVIPVILSQKKKFKQRIVVDYFKIDTIKKEISTMQSIKFWLKI